MAAGHTGSASAVQQQRGAGAPGCLAVLGSTGSIGTQTLDVVRRNPGRFRVCALAARDNVDLIASQIEEFRPALVTMADPEAAAALRRRAGGLCEIAAGPEGIIRCAALPEVHTVVAAVIGFAGLEAVLEAVRCGKHVAQANKEVLVAAGPLLTELLAHSVSAIVPVDSEHNSLFQCMLGRGTVGLRRVVLTASGGPFLDYTLAELESVTPEQAVKHPNWAMGPKISIDSASLMNKGLEVLEAAVLFGLPSDKIEVLIHPQSVLHGLAEYEEGTAIAALYKPDMRVPIGFALEYLRSSNPKREPGSGALSTGVEMLDLARSRPLEFYEPDLERFPSLALAYRALDAGGSMPTVLNAANEAAVEAFCDRRIGFREMSKLVAEVMVQHEVQPLATTADIIQADAWARVAASNYIVETAAASEEPPYNELVGK